MDEQTFEEIKKLAIRAETSVAIAVMAERGIEDNQENWDAFWGNALNESDAFWDSLMGARYNILTLVYGEDLYTEFMDREYPEA